MEIKREGMKLFVDGIEYVPKESTPEVKQVDWEILKGGFGSDTAHTWEESCHRVGCDIWSVRRISDNTIWTVGDDCFHGPIVRFNLRNDQITADFEYGDVGCSKLLSELSKPLQRTPLFKTEDGVDIFKGDNFWYVTPPLRMFNDMCDSMTGGKYVAHSRVGDKFFSTEEAAKEYVILNKPCLSASDILAIWSLSGDARQRIIELAKQKLDKH